MFAAMEDMETPIVVLRYSLQCKRSCSKTVVEGGTKVDTARRTFRAQSLTAPTRYPHLHGSRKKRPVIFFSLIMVQTSPQGAANGIADSNITDLNNAAIAARQHTNANSSVEKWDHFATSILKQGYWNRLGNLTKPLDTLPLDIDEMFNEIEERTSVRLNEEQRLMYYAEFTRTALGSTTLHFRDVEALIVRKNPEIMVNRIEFLTLVTNKFHELSKETSDQSL